MPELFIQYNCNHPQCSLVGCATRYWYLSDSEIVEAAAKVETLLVLAQRGSDEEIAKATRLLNVQTLKGASVNAVSAAVVKQSYALYNQDVRKEDVGKVATRAKENLSTRRWYENSR